MTYFYAPNHCSHVADYYRHLSAVERAKPSKAARERCKKYGSTAYFLYTLTYERGGHIPATHGKFPVLA